MRIKGFFRKIKEKIDNVIFRNTDLLIPIFVVVFFGLVVSLITNASWKSSAEESRKELNSIEENYKFYKNLIEKAENNGNIEYASVVSVHEDEFVNYYYIVYQLPRSEFTSKTFSVFTYEEAMEYKENGKIQIALEHDIVTRYTKSIDVGLKNFDLEELPVYSTYTSLIPYYNNMHVISIVSSIIFGSLFGYITINYMLLNKVGKSKKEMQKNVAVFEKAEMPRCPYCGSAHHVGVKKCKYCGASL